MQLRLSELLKWSARTPEQVLSVDDVLFDAGSGRLAYLVVGTGGWGRTEHALVAASLVAEHDCDAKEITLALTEDELSRAPRWEGRQSQLASLLASLPPLVVGPFGATHAPLAMAAATGPEVTTDDHDDPRISQAMDSFERLGGWMGKPVFARDGEAGTLTDLIYDSKRERIEWMVIDHPGASGRQERVLPYDSLGHRVDDAKGGHIILDRDTRDLSAAPHLADMDFAA